LLDKGAKAVYAYATHGVLSGGAVARIRDSKLKSLVVTDSIAATEEIRKAPNIRRILDRAALGESHRSHRQRKVRCRRCSISENMAGGRKVRAARPQISTAAPRSPSDVPAISFAHRRAHLAPAGERPALAERRAECRTRRR
jgi:hypothetical protein